MPNPNPNLQILEDLSYRVNGMPCSCDKDDLIPLALACVLEDLIGEVQKLRVELDFLKQRVGK